MKDKTCRDSYPIGNACGRCKKCEALLLKLIDQLRDADECSYDHHGFCQAHSLHEKPCPHEVAAAIFSAISRR